MKRKSTLSFILFAITVGLLSTVVMDILSAVCAMLNISQSLISINEMGRYFSGWLCGDFFHDSLANLKPVPFEEVLGILYHYLIGTFLATVMIIIFKKIPKFGSRNRYLIGIPVLYGTLTSIFPWFILAPGIGWGIMGYNAPPEVMVIQATIINHIAYGIGLSAIYNIIIRIDNIIKIFKYS